MQQPQQLPLIQHGPTHTQHHQIPQHSGHLQQSQIGPQHGQPPQSSQHDWHDPNEPMELICYKSLEVDDHDVEEFQEMPMELTKVFSPAAATAGPLELIVRNEQYQTIHSTSQQQQQQQSSIKEHYTNSLTHHPYFQHQQQQPIGELLCLNL